MPSSDPTVADRIAEGEATIAIFCSTPNRDGCGHSAVVHLDTLDPQMTRSRLARYYAATSPKTVGAAAALCICRIKSTTINISRRSSTGPSSR